MSISKCLEAFGEEARDMATGNFKAASVLELAKAKREEKAPTEGSKTDKVRGILLRTSWIPTLRYWMYTSAKPQNLLA